MHRSEGYDAFCLFVFVCMLCVFLAFYYHTFFNKREVSKDSALNGNNSYKHNLLKKYFVLQVMTSLAYHFMFP